MKKVRLLLLLLLAAALLGGCAGQSAPSAPAPTPTPEPTEPPAVMIGALRLDAESVCADLGGTGDKVGEAIRSLVDSRALLSSLREIRLGETLPPYELYRSLREAYPEAQIELELRLFGETLSRGVRTLDLHEMRPEQTDELLAVLPYLEELEEIGFVSPEGVCAFTLDDIPQLDRIREAAPELRLHVSFDLFGQTVSDEDERIEYYLVPIGNEGAETVRAVLPYLRSCSYFLLDGCDIDNEVLAQLRDDFPDKKIVWRVWIIEPWYSSRVMMRRGSFLTDTERIRTTLVRPENCDVLKYCTETKYVDFGHNFLMSDFSFLACMPKLEACIIAISRVSDLTPLASCPELEYLEVFTTDVADLSPLTNCKKLEYLNISNCKKLTDITPLYGMTSLKVLRMTATLNVPREQKEELARRLPDLTILNVGADPTEGGWRTMPRYFLLREQMKYDEDWLLYGIP